MRNFLIIILLITSVASAQIGIGQELVAGETILSQSNAYAGSTVKVALKLKIEETWHINSDRPNDEFLIPSELLIKTDNAFTIENIGYPKAKDIELKFSDVPVSVFEGEVSVFADLKIPNDIGPGTYNFNLVFNYQACNDESCMPPNSVESEGQIDIVTNDVPIESVNSDFFTQRPALEQNDVTGNDDSIASTLESSGILLSILIVFIGGLALNLTPCVYPLIPITVGYFGGQSEGRTGKLFVLGVVYVLGMALTYSVIGVVTAMSGAVFGALLQNPIVIIVIAAVLVGLSLSMFGVYEFKFPDSWVMKAGGAKSGLFGAFFMGLTLGIVAAPCIGPFVLGLLTVVAAKGDILYGFLMFFFLAVGLGTPYLILAMFSGKIKALPKAGFWMEGVKHIFGILLVGMAIYFLLPVLPKEIGSFILPVFMIIAALYLIFFDKMGNDVVGFKIFKYIFSVVIIAVAAYFLFPADQKAPAWKYYSDAVYVQAIDTNQKIIIDFYADWCIPCKELDALTFSDERVIEETGDFVAIKVDMTKTMSDETEKIRNKFNILGMPTILIFNSEGEEVHRLTGFVNADEFLKLISNIN